MLYYSEGSISHITFIPAALVPGQVQNLRSTLDPDIPTLTLHWDKPKNMNTDGDVKSYDIRFKPCGSEGNYCKETVVAPATSVILTRDSGLKPMTKYKFEVQARSTSQEGKWNELSEYFGMFIFMHSHGTNFILIESTPFQNR